MKQTGFTLIELIVTIAVAIILATVAVPSFQTIIKNNKLATTANDLISGIALARTEAIKRGARVSMCASTDQATCSTSRTNWDSGWLVFTDPDADGVLDAGEELIRVANRSGPPTIRQSATTILSYRGVGFRNDTDPPIVINICDDRGADFARQLSINTAGRTRVCRDADDGCTLSCP